MFLSNSFSWCNLVNHWFETSWQLVRTQGGIYTQTIATQSCCLHWAFLFKTPHCGVVFCPLNSHFPAQVMFVITVKVILEMFEMDGDSKVDTKK